MIEVKGIQTSIPNYKLTNEKRETVITFNETGEPANVFTYNPAFIKKLDLLSESRPEDVACIRAESINGVQLREYEIPKKCSRFEQTEFSQMKRKKCVRKLPQK